VRLWNTHRLSTRNGLHASTAQPTFALSSCSVTRFRQWAIGFAMLTTPKATKRLSLKKNTTPQGGRFVRTLVQYGLHGGMLWFLQVACSTGTTAIGYLRSSSCKCFVKVPWSIAAENVSAPNSVIPMLARRRVRIPVDI
jgi:hypothetical protein